MWINSILNLIFPEKCFGCGKEKILLCQKCAAKLPYPETEKNEPDIFGAASYESPVIKKLIKALKYKKAGRAAKPLAELLSSRLSPMFEVELRTLVIIPIPLSPKRLRERGFNQAELIARHLSEIMSVKILTNVLYKNRHTVSQVEIKDRQKRLKNLEGTFSVKNAELIKDKEIFVLDDVSTTGATINEARRALKKAGAKKVIGLVAAR
ncbi:ComF family protein [Patescibacteria group bacterium]|nr:ComF family protein [Patescibacteria group bacterium]